MCLFVAGGEVGAVLFEGGLTGAACLCEVLVGVVGVLVGLEGGAEGFVVGGVVWEGGVGVGCVVVFVGGCL